ncbi:MAG TPA: Nramp family divalent metal transporter [Streptosporangiaceae bacterium]
MRRIAALCGPAFVVSVAYVDPGNFATNMSGGASYGYTLLWVIAVANLVAMFVQALSAKLGIATGQSLAALCRRHLPRPLTWLLWAQGEMIAIATDLAEFLGGAIALNLLFGVPLLPAAGVTAVVSAGLLALAPHGRRRFETVITGLLAVICAGFVYQAVLSPHLSRAAAGLVPHLAGRGSLVIAAGIVGATVMPHVIHLHSALTSNQALTRDQGETVGRAEAMRASRVDIGVALGVAGLVNMAMLVVAAAVLPGRDASTLTAIQADLSGLLGRGAAVAFALALLASGLASSSVGTYAGQVIMEGFLQRRVPLAVRRLVTMAPAFALLAAGADPVRLLIVSQVALSVGLPSVLIPLVVLTSRRSIMGALVNRRVTTVTAIVVTAGVIGLSGVLLCLALTA